MRSTIIGFVLGAIALQLQGNLPNIFMLCLLAVLALLIIFFASSRCSSRWKISTWLLGGACLGFSWAAAMAHLYLRQELPSEWEGRDITVIGTIENLPYRFDQGTRFHFAVEHVLPVDGQQPLVPSKLSLSWYTGFYSDSAQTVVRVRPGERWQLTVRLKRPHGNANPEGFDYELWLLEQNLRATGTVRSDSATIQKNQRLDSFVLSFSHLVEATRAHLRDRIEAALSGKEYAGVIVALVIGDQRAISQSDWKVFNRSGIGHLISISGLHITMVAGLFASIAYGLWRRSFYTAAQLPLILPAQKVAAFVGAGVALMYVLLAGFGVPAQRTLYMLSIVALALWMGRMTSVSHILCAALGFVVLLDPWAVLWPGFWLSFGAVGLILYVSVGRAHLPSHAMSSRKQRWMHQLQSALRTQYAITLGLVPLTMLLFGQTSLISPIANAVAIPLVSLIVTPLALIGSVLPSQFSSWVLYAAHEVIAYLAVTLTYLSDFSMAVWSAPKPPFWMFGVAMIGTFWMLAPRGWPLRWLGLLAWLPMVLNTPSHPKQGEMWVTAFDVGQGMALLIETQHRRLLYDTGPFYSPESDGGNRVILPYLKARGIHALDGIIISHSDNDHSGGALSILKEVSVNWMASSLSPSSPIVQAASEHHRCEAGQSWVWDEAHFEILHPTKVSYDSHKWKPNARSCTLKISIGTQSILLAGDIEAVQEAELIESSAEKLPSTVLLAPHHGSGTSSTEQFLRLVKPTLGIFQVGYRNRYHHPKLEVLDRYSKLGIERIRTDVSGAVKLQLGSAMEVLEFRKEHLRYWYGR